MGTAACPQSDSTCAGAGGGLAVFYAAVDFVGGEVLENDAVTDTEFSPRGGGVFGFFDNHDLSGGSGNIGVFNGTVFSRNRAMGRDVAAGGGAWINGGVTFLGCAFEGNAVTSETLNSLEYNSGGAMYVQRSAQDSADARGDVIVSRGNFTGNVVESGGYGGAVFAKGSTELTVEGTTFKGNLCVSSQRIKAAGGAVAFTGGVRASIAGGEFEGNWARPYEGSSYVLTPDSSSMPLPDGLSGEGGAAFFEASTVDVTGTRFANNGCASGYDQGAAGGAISLVASVAGSESRFTGVSFVSNSAISDEVTTVDKASGMGGAVHVMSASPVFQSCTFTDNMVKAGGSKNSVGGAVVLRYAYEGGATLRTPRGSGMPSLAVGGPKFLDCDFVKNRALGDTHSSSGLSIMQSGRGGGLAAVASLVYMSNCSFSQNIATARENSLVPSLGGGVYLDYDSRGYFIGSTFEHNRADAGSEVTSIAVVRENAEQSDDTNSTSLYFFNTTFETLAVKDIKRPRLLSPHLLVFGGTARFFESKFDLGTSIVIAGPGSLDLFGGYLEDVVLANARLFVSGPLDQAKVDLLAWNAELNFEATGIKEEVRGE